MLDAVFANVLGWIGGRAERLSWWAYDRGNRARHALARRRALKAAGPSRIPSTYMPHLPLPEPAQALPAQRLRAAG